MFSGEVVNTIVIVFGLTRQRLETTIYRTRGEQANHYTTGAVNPSKNTVLPVYGKRNDKFLNFS